MSKSRVEKLSKSRVRVRFTVEPAEVDMALASAKTIVDDLQKRPLGVKQVGENKAETVERAILSRATRAVAEDAIKQLVEEGGIRLTSNPKADLEEFVEAGRPFEFEIELAIVPQYELFSYDPVEIVVDDSFVATAEEVSARLEEVRSRSAEVEKNSNKPIAAANDVVELSFESFIDGRTYKGSRASSFSYTMGSKSLPQAFEDGLVGMVVGEEKAIEFVVPVDYANAEIAGKLARFDVKVGRVASCTLPEIDEEFARSFGYESLAAWKEKMACEISREKESRYQGSVEASARAALAERLVGELEDGMIDAQAESMFSAFKADLEQQGVQFAEYCRFLGLTESMVREEMRCESELILRENLALESLFRYLNLSVSEEDIQVTADMLAKESGMGEPLLLSNLLPQQRDALREMTIHRMATERLLETALVKSA